MDATKWPENDYNNIYKICINLNTFIFPIGHLGGQVVNVTWSVSTPVIIYIPHEKIVS